MTSAAIPVLRREAWFDSISAKLYSRRYDSRDLAVAGKNAMLVGMGMTEQQGGSDLRGNTTRAFALAQDGRRQSYKRVGCKWFFSWPVSIAHLLRTRSGKAITCFLVS